MNNIEEKLWNYIDGTCTPEEQLAIERLIESDDLYRHKYQELLALNMEFSQMELDEPPMAFTYNVMEAIRAEEARVPLNAGINKNIIRGITGLFVLIIASLIIYAMFNINWAPAHASEPAIKFTMPQFKLPQIKSSVSAPIMKGFIFFDVIVGLFFFDSYLRKQRKADGQA